MDERLQNLQKLHKYGLPKDINIEALLAVCQRNDLIRKTHFHEFQKFSKEHIKKNNNCIYDIPMYVEDAPEYFSLFESVSERISIIKYRENKNIINNNNLNENNNNNNKEKKTINYKMKNFLEMPKPNTNHSYYHICKCKYEDYTKHVECELHIKNLNKKNKEFKKINNNTFNRIGMFLEGKKDIYEDYIMEIEKEENSKK